MKMPENVYSNTYQALNLLVENSKIAQETFKEHALLLSSIGFYKEYCTIKLCTARQCGHSQALVQLALNAFKRPLIISPNETMVRYLHAKMVNEVKDDPYAICKRNTVTFENKENSYVFESVNIKNHFKKWMTLDIDAIIVDCSALVKPSFCDFIYDELSERMIKEQYKFFIFIQ